MNCPLCGENLLKIDMLEDYICPTRVIFPNNYETTHYELRAYGTNNAVSLWHLPPYQVINGDRSAIYLYYAKDNQNVSTSPYVRKILDIPAISPDSPEKIIERIKRLIIFS